MDDNASSSSSSSVSSTSTLWDFKESMKDDEINRNGLILKRDKSWMKRNHKGMNESDDDDDDDNKEDYCTTMNGERTTLRTILHLDVDCFYCQCESIRNPKLATKPFAVGQKHIIVTCNYIARKLGIQKLMLRQSAKQICPNLIIIEGSDLQHYRKFSRTIYTSFRHAIHNNNYHHHPKVAVKKGGMDEMFADISGIMDDKLMKNNEQKKNDQSHTKLSSFPSSCFVFGNTSSSSSSSSMREKQKRISITEDQTGSKVEIFDRQYSTFIDASSSSPSSLPQYPFKKDQVIFRTACVDRLKIASHIATDIQTRIKEETGFTTCIGISTSPMMAKLASELQVCFLQSICMCVYFLKRITPLTD